MSTYNLFESLGATLKADSVCQAFVEGMIRLMKAEEGFNRDNSTRKVSYAKMSLDFLTGILTGSVTLPLKPDVDAATFKVNHSRIDYTPGYAAFVPGTGSVKDATNLQDAIALIADRIDTVERYILADIVTITPNTVKIVEDTDNNLMTINFGLPLSILIDETNGGLLIKARGFLQRLDDQIAAGEVTGLPV
jgi:hypothetical protein